jgi:hypothetical protein
MVLFVQVQMVFNLLYNTIPTADDIIRTVTYLNKFV